jgi:hypothetical protein
VRLYVAKPDKINDGIALMGPRLQGDGLVVVEVDSAFANGFLSGIAFVGETFMQLRVVEGCEDLRESDVVASRWREIKYQ